MAAAEAPFTALLASRPLKRKLAREARGLGLMD